MKRVNPSKRMRFEVLKRDSFRCQYCGAAAPDVVLNIDHILPVAKGGKTNLLNLVTSCKDCNVGKTDRLLSDGAAIKTSQRQADELAQKKQDMDMMLKWRASLSSLEEDKVNAFDKAMVETAACSLTPEGKTFVRKILKKYDLPEALSALDIAFAQYGKENLLDRVGGILKQRKEERENPGGAKIRHAINILRKVWGYSWRDAYFTEILSAAKGLLPYYDHDDLFKAIKCKRSISEVRDLMGQLKMREEAK